MRYDRSDRLVRSCVRRNRVDRVEVSQQIGLEFRLREIGSVWCIRLAFEELRRDSTVSA